ncbi:MAG: integral membrane sensor signal transduction histidine kinase [Pseudonocardiales bacterium]|nr:MAG: integral membrane sensor signal transduction histidine kinase [Pseudonocardiales bacterium]
MTPETVVGAPGGPPSPGAPTRPNPDDSLDWVTIASPAQGPVLRAEDRPVRLRRVVLQLGADAIIVLLLVAVAGSIVSRRTAESQSVHEAAELADVLATSVVQPLLTDAMVNDPAAARAALDSVVRSRVLSASVVRVKVWTPQGKILYSDEARLSGRTFPLDDSALAVLAAPQTRAEVSDLHAPENLYERTQGKLLEVYRPVWTPSGDELLFETYFRYDTVNDRANEMWRGFAGIMVSSLGVIFVLLLPLVWTLVARIRRGQEQREALMQRALDASLEERQRIAATLHDGAVQELAAASFAVAGAAETAASRGDTALAAELRDAAGAVRTSIGGLRSLLVDIYPPALRSAGLSAALRDLVATMAGRGPAVDLDVQEDAAAALQPEEQAAVFRIVQELLRNVVRHARAEHVTVSLLRQDHQIRVTVADDGVGFDPARSATEGHFGLRLITDLAGATGAGLQVRTAPGDGTIWRLSVPAG